MVLLKMDGGGSRVAHPVKRDRENVGCWSNMGSAHREGLIRAVDEGPVGGETAAKAQGQATERV